MAWFLDANVCIHHWRGRHPHLSARWRGHPSSEVFIPVTAYGELLLGAEKSSQPDRVRAQIEQLLVAHDLVGITADVAVHYARIRMELERRGEIIGANDLWIGATALAHDAVLVTGNTGEFSRIHGLALEDWSLPDG
ncbi:MAG: type II toxin-antitoxin system VapC family toxin [Chthoniobacteraceae bacterium]